MNNKKKYRAMRADVTVPHLLDELYIFFIVSSASFAW